MPILEIQLLGSKSTHALSSSEVLFAFYPADQIKNPKRLLATLKLARDEFSPDLSAQLEEKVDDLLEKTKDGKELSPPHALDLICDGGGSVHYLFLDELKNGATRPHLEFLRDSALKILKREREEIVRFDLSGLKDRDAAMVLEWIASLVAIAEWHPPLYGKKHKKQSEKKPKHKTVEIVTALKPKDVAGVLAEGQALGEANNLVRTLANMPSNDLNPIRYLELIESRAKMLGYQIEFYSARKLEAMKAGAFLAVIQGSKGRSGGIVRLSYRPKKGAKKVKRAVLVGKGLCFDTGGHNLKTSNYMHGMHRDMTGSAVALALFEAFVKLEAPLEVEAFLALAENMISPDAYRPNDIVVASDGTSIEVVDTDAEGRMVLADTLVLAKKEKPGILIDFATLTGSAVRAIGTERSAVFSNNDNLLKAAHEAGERTGDRVWGFPIGDEFAKKLESESADIMQCAVSGPGDHMLAATFLSHFVGKETPWLHCDLSADTNKGGLGLVDTETTGFGVRLGFALIRDWLEI